MVTACYLVDALCKYKIRAFIQSKNLMDSAIKIIEYDKFIIQSNL